MLNKQLSALSLFIFFTASICFGQLSSPYTKFGFGHLSNSTFSSALGAGKLGAAWSKPNEINLINPASYADLSLTVLDVGLNADALFISTNDSLYQTVDGGINHLALGFAIPMKGKLRWGMSMGLKPFSNVSYSFNRMVNDAIVGDHEEIFNGGGRTYKVYWGNGLSINKFKFGINAALVFGSISHTSWIIFPDSLNAFSIRDNSNTRHVGLEYDLGLMYDDNLSNKIKLKIGFYGRPNINLRAVNSRLVNRINITSNGVATVDTLLSEPETMNTTILPAKLGAGFTLSNHTDRTNDLVWIFGADAEYNAWSQYQSVLDNYQAVDSWIAKVGGEVIPNASTDANYFESIAYRFGFNAGSSEVQVGDHQLSEYGITFGFGLPTVRKIPTGTADKLKVNRFNNINLSFEIGGRGRLTDQLFQENYFRTVVAFNYNDIWFQKRKFD